MYIFTQWKLNNKRHRLVRIIQCRYFILINYKQLLCVGRRKRTSIVRKCLMVKHNVTHKKMAFYPLNFTNYRAIKCLCRLIIFLKLVRIQNPFKTFFLLLLKTFTAKLLNFVWVYILFTQCVSLIKTETFTTARPQQYTTQPS